MLPEGSRTAKSFVPQNCSVGSWTISAPLARTASKVASTSSLRKWTPFSARFTELVGETPTAYRDSDHGELVSVSGCVAKDLTRPSRKRSRIQEAAGAPAP